MRSKLVPGLMVAIALGGCQHDAGPPQELVPRLGILAWQNMPIDSSHQGLADSGYWDPEKMSPLPPLVAPDTVRAGEPFEVQVTTVLPDRCWDPGPYVLTHTGSAVEIAVYDYWNGSEICLLAASWNTRSFELVFNRAGEGTVTAVGRRVAGVDVREAGEHFSITRTIVVR